jgi:hypothetical protein
MKLIFRLLLISFVLIVMSFNRFDQKVISNGEELIGLMYRTYSESWYHHLTFKQEMFRYRNDSLIRNEVWSVAYSAPGRLHIRYQDFDSGRGWLIINDSLYSFNHGKLIGVRARFHELMTLGLDAYVVSPDVIISKLKSMEFDLDIIEETIINGKSVFQVGNPDIQCFWILKENLLFYGLRKAGDMGVRETFFENYKLHYGMPVATQIHYYQDGSLYLYEKYFEIRLPSTLPGSYFDPELFTETRW